MKKREDLVKAQTLFNLPITSYPELSNMERELKLLQVVYDVYVQHVAKIGDFWDALVEARRAAAGEAER
jgi:dynein heavy chain